MNELIWYFLYYAELECWFGDLNMKPDAKSHLEEAYAIFFCY